VLLRQFGHAVITSRDIGMRYSDDAEHLLYAADHSRILVTRDNDFLGLHVAWHLWPRAWGVLPPPQHAGILIIPSQWRGIQAAREIETFLLRGPLPTNVLYRYEVPSGAGVGH
jgi:hypothetical protein